MLLDVRDVIIIHGYIHIAVFASAADWRGWHMYNMYMYMYIYFPCSCGGGARWCGLCVHGLVMYIAFVGLRRDHHQVIGGV